MGKRREGELDLGGLVMGGGGGYRGKGRGRGRRRGRGGVG